MDSAGKRRIYCPANTGNVTNPIFNQNHSEMKQALIMAAVALFGVLIGAFSSETFRNKHLQLEVVEATAIEQIDTTLDEHRFIDSYLNIAKPGEILQPAPPLITYEVWCNCSKDEKREMRHNALPNRNYLDKTHIFYRANLTTNLMGKQITPGVLNTIRFCPEGRTVEKKQHVIRVVRKGKVLR